jgi:H+/Cl- antiporter ClcA
MTRNVRMRQGHRWISIAFTLTVIANFAARAYGKPPPWFTYPPLLPLFLLLLSGLYLFWLPYFAKLQGASDVKQASAAFLEKRSKKLLPRFLG